MFLLLFKVIIRKLWSNGHFTYYNLPIMTPFLFNNASLSFFWKKIFLFCRSTSTSWIIPPPQFPQQNCAHYLFLPWGSQSASGNSVIYILWVYQSFDSNFPYTSFLFSGAHDSGTRSGSKTSSPAPYPLSLCRESFSGFMKLKKPQPFLAQRICFHDFWPAIFMTFCKCIASSISSL